MHEIVSHPRLWGSRGCDYLAVRQRVRYPSATCRTAEGSHNTYSIVTAQEPIFFTLAVP